jgi:ribosomal RNA-processing protein 12
VVFGLADRMAQAKALPQFLTLLAAGLAGKSSHMMVAAVGCMARTLLKYKDDGIPPDFSSQLLGTASLLLHHSSPAVVKGALDFWKVATQAIDVEVLAAHLPQLIPGLLRWIRESNETRLKIRYLLQRLMRKLGQELVYGTVPETHHKLLVNITKMHENTQKMKKKKAKEHAAKPKAKRDPLDIWSDDDDDDSDDDDGEHDTVSSGGGTDMDAHVSSGRSSRSNTVSWLHESQGAGGADDAEPLDLLSASATRHVSFQDPRRLANAERASAKLVSAS